MKTVFAASLASQGGRFLLLLITLSIPVLASVAQADVRLRDGESIFIGGERVSCGTGRVYLPSECRDAFAGVGENFKRCVAGTSNPTGKTNCRFQTLDPFMKEHKECVSVVGSTCFDLCIAETPGGQGQFYCKYYCGLPI